MTTATVFLSKWCVLTDIILRDATFRLAIRAPSLDRSNQRATCPSEAIVENHCPTLGVDWRALGGMAQLVVVFYRLQLPILIYWKFNENDYP
eukprot:3247536-Amphidinium_carterae.1